MHDLNIPFELRDLLKRGWFRFWLFGPIILGIAVGLLIAYVNDLGLDISKPGFALFFELLPKKFSPAYYIAALSIPLVTIYLAVHRSELTQAQIETQQRQNLYVNYFSHRKFFEEYIVENKSLEGITAMIVNPRLLHEVLFENMRYGNNEINTEIIGRLKFHNKKLNDLAIKIQREKSIRIR